MMGEFEVEELVEYIKTGIRVAKASGTDHDFLVKAVEALLPTYLKLDDAIERVRQVAIDMELVEEEE